MSRTAIPLLKSRSENHRTIKFQGHPILLSMKCQGQ